MKTIKQVEKEIELMEMQYGMDTHAVRRAHQNVEDSFLKLNALRAELRDIQNETKRKAEWEDLTWSGDDPPRTIEIKVEMELRSCNRHLDCKAAEETWSRRHGTPWPGFVPHFHCYSEECTDCFGDG